MDYLNVFPVVTLLDLNDSKDHPFFCNFVCRNCNLHAFFALCVLFE